MERDGGKAVMTEPPVPNIAPMGTTGITVTVTIIAM